jgi:hypothetical protein
MPIDLPPVAWVGIVIAGMWLLSRLSSGRGIGKGKGNNNNSGNNSNSNNTSGSNNNNYPPTN